MNLSENWSYDLHHIISPPLFVLKQVSLLALCSFHIQTFRTLSYKFILNGNMPVKIFQSF